MFICLDFTEVIKHSLANWVLRLWNESFLSWFLFSLLLHQIASSNCKQHVTGTGISLFCPGVGTVYPWAMFLQDIPGTQCHYPNLKDLALKRKSCQWSWIDIYPSDSLLRRSIQGKGWNWRKMCPPPPPHYLRDWMTALYQKVCIRHWFAIFAFSTFLENRKIPKGSINTFTSIVNFSRYKWTWQRRGHDFSSENGAISVITQQRQNVVYLLYFNVTFSPHFISVVSWFL